MHATWTWLVNKNGIANMPVYKDNKNNYITKHSNGLEKSK